MSTELKPCPFCGWEAEFYDAECGYDGIHNAVMCSRCSACCESADEWNTRADGWISVEDHHIEWGCIVAIPLANDGFYINTVSVGEEGDLFDIDGSYIGYHASQVSHWMPLPNHPKVK